MRTPRFIIVAALVAALMFVVLLLLGRGQNAHARAPAQAATPTAPAQPVHTMTMTATTTPASNEQPVAGILYQDDFTDTASGWPNAFAFDNYYIGYHEPSFFHVEVHTPRDKAIVSIPKQTFGDVTLESKVFTDPNNTAQSGDFRYGLVFRRAGNQYYAFAISPRTKTWYVLKSSPSGVTELKKGTDDSIQGLKAPDALRVDARGPTFAFHINDRLAGQVSDPDYADGSAGFMVETFDSPRAHIHYDTISARQIEAAQPECTVIAGGLNVRSGPGIYNTILTFARQGTRAGAIGRSDDGNWLNVRLDNVAAPVWISSAPIYVSCDTPVRDLPIIKP
jgi:hypothetical protein